jgi:transcriptional regulator with PAS, ATPase and Fis domain
MSLLRRIVVASRKPQLHEIAQEVAREVFAADDLGEAISIVATVAPEMVVFDATFTPAQVREYRNGAPGDRDRPPAIIVVARQGSAYSDSEYQEAGASHCLSEEQEYGRLRDIAAQISAAAVQQVTAPAQDDHYFLNATAAAAGLVGRSKAIGKTLQMVELVAASQCNPILIVGDTGTGKEVVARAVHLLRHPGAPFVAVNCAALTATLLESELFGHVKGSFTGADRDKTGLLELAGTGTIFLDEISEMPLELQAKLLRVLQEKTFRKVGGTRDSACQATMIASSNRDLKKEVREKHFRQDLFYRLNICPIILAPLRSPDRRGDIPVLAEYFLKTSNICAGKRDQITSITRLAMEALCRHDWPGNVRELRHAVERAVLLETTDKIGLSSIVIDPMESDGPAGAGSQRKDFSLEKAECELIARALHETGWQKTQAAALLGITRATLYAKVKQYNLRPAAPPGSEADTSTDVQPAETEVPVAV